MSEWLWAGKSGGEDLASIYLFKVNNENSRAMCEICSKITIKTPERHQWHQLWADFTPCSWVCIVDFEQVNSNWGNKDGVPVRFIKWFHSFCSCNQQNIPNYLILLQGFEIFVFDSFSG